MSRVSIVRLRRLVAWGGHAPGLWLCFREPLPSSLRRPNAVAVLLTLVAMLVAGLLASPSERLAAVGATWLAGHVLWGSYLAWKLPARAGE